MWAATVPNSTVAEVDNYLVWLSFHGERINPRVHMRPKIIFRSRTTSQTKHPSRCVPLCWIQLLFFLFAAALARTDVRRWVNDRVQPGRCVCRGKVLRSGSVLGRKFHEPFVLCYANL